MKIFIQNVENKKKKVAPLKRAMLPDKNSS